MTKAQLGSKARPLRVAVIGSGPSAFYAVEALFKAEGLHVRADVFDRLPTPHGLVRGGVAPDHQKIKAVTRVYDKVAADPRFRFFGNVCLGKDIQVTDLQEHYDQIIYAVGNEDSRDLGIPGEDLIGVHSATEFVFWYNGHPDYRNHQFDLGGARRVAVVGNGNVAIDVARILIKDPDALQETDIADHALQALRQSCIEEVLLLGRRGPAQAAFSPKEIQEIQDLDNVDLLVAPKDMNLDEISRNWITSKAPKSAQRNVKILTEQAQQDSKDQGKKVKACFLVSPVEINGEAGKVCGIKLQKNKLGLDNNGAPRPKAIDVFQEEAVQLVFKAIGYRGTPIPGVPFHDNWGIIPNQDGRVRESANGQVLANQYVVGWAKRGPTGLIGTNSPDSKATVAQMVADLADQHKATLPQGEEKQIPQLLASRNIPYFSFADWQILDQLERQQGEATGRVRCKYTDIAAMLAAVQKAKTG